MRSMTGFGSARASDGERMYSVEVRSLNHRYCDVHVHVPNDLSGIEARLEARVRKQLERGRVDVTIDVGFSPAASVTPRVDLARARGYRDAYLLVAHELGMEAQLTLESIVNAPGVIRAGEGIEDTARVATSLEPAVDAAIQDLLAMRSTEGNALERELKQRLEQVRGLVEEVRQELPRANQERKTRLEQRVQELLGDRAIDPGRLAQEVAIIVDRADVTEELARFGSHVSQFESLLKSKDGIGRKLDFLLQEMHREANTVGSKTGSARISHIVVGLKSELERMREQVQNVE